MPYPAYLLFAFGEGLKTIIPHNHPTFPLVFLKIPLKNHIAADVHSPQAPENPSLVQL